MRPDLGADTDGPLRHGAAPPDVVADDLADGEQVGGADDDLPTVGVDLDDVPRFPVQARAVQTQAAALAHGEAMRSRVSPDHGPRRRVHEIPRRRAERPGQEAARITVRDEADVVGVRLAGDREAARGGLFPDPRLRRVAEREVCAGQLVGGQDTEDIRLVLRRVGGTVQLAPLGAVEDARVVPGRDPVETEGDRLVQQRRELDPLVAPQAGVGRAAGGVLGREVVDDIALEALREVPHVERDPQAVGDPPGVSGVLQGAAPSC